jgi:hypothetical protein
MKKTLVSLVLILTAATVNAQVVATRGPVPQLLIPAAGAQAGNNGTFFRSDITLINYRSADQRVRLQWLPQGSSGVGMAPVDITISASSGIASEDFVTTVMQQSGLGAILVTGIDSNGVADPSALLVATSRIWTPAAGGGTQSQSLPSVAVADIASTNVSILGERRDSRYRTNAGIVNLSQTTQTFQVTVLGTFGTETHQQDVPAMSMALFGITGASSTTPLQIAVQNIGAPPRSSLFIAYASSVDNITGDAWTALGFNVGVPAP